MVEAVWQGLTQVLQALKQQLKQLVDALSGKDRRDKRRLLKHLSRELQINSLPVRIEGFCRVLVSS
jgi:hypothetical protein